MSAFETESNKTNTTKLKFDDSEIERFNDEPPKKTNKVLEVKKSNSTLLMDDSSIPTPLAKRKNPLESVKNSLNFDASEIEQNVSDLHLSFKPGSFLNSRERYTKEGSQPSTTTKASLKERAKSQIVLEKEQPRLKPSKSRKNLILNAESSEPNENEDPMSTESRGPKVLNKKKTTSQPKTNKQLRNKTPEPQVLKAPVQSRSQTPNPLSNNPNYYNQSEYPVMQRSNSCFPNQFFAPQNPYMNMSPHAYPMPQPYFPNPMLSPQHHIPPLNMYPSNTYHYVYQQPTTQVVYPPHFGSSPNIFPPTYQTTLTTLNSPSNYQIPSAHSIPSGYPSPHLTQPLRFESVPTMPSYYTSTDRGTYHSRTNTLVGFKERDHFLDTKTFNSTIDSRVGDERQPPSGYSSHFHSRKTSIATQAHPLPANKLNSYLKETKKFTHFPTSSKQLSKELSNITQDEEDQLLVLKGGFTDTMTTTKTESNQISSTEPMSIGDLGSNVKNSQRKVYVTDSRSEQNFGDLATQSKKNDNSVVQSSIGLSEPKSLTPAKKSEKIEVMYLLYFL